MAVKVSYKQGTKKTYLGLASRSSSALYFCTDTKELFKGDDLYTDGLRFVQNYSSLPEFSLAADGVIYYVIDEKVCYVLLPERNGWLKLSEEYDGITIGRGTSGLVEVKAVPISKVTGLEDRLAAIEAAAIGGVHYKGSVPTVDALPNDAAQGDLYEVEADNSEWCWNGEKWFECGRTTGLGPVATAELDSEQFEVKDNVIHLKSVDADTVKYRGDDLDNALDQLSQAVMWEDMGTEVDPAAGNAANTVAQAQDGDVLNFSKGTVSEAITVQNSVAVRGAAAGFAQNFKQEV